MGQVQYADGNGAFVAFQVLGEGARDLLVMMDGFIPLDAIEGEPRLARCMDRLNSFARLIRFDRRGVGLSDPVSPHAPPTLEQWVEDAVAVLDAVGSRRAVVLASCEMSSVGLLLAATHPARVESLVVVNSYARALVDVDYSDGLTVDDLAQVISAMTEVQPVEGADDFVFTVAPSAAHDPEFRKWWWKPAGAARARLPRGR